MPDQHVPTAGVADETGPRHAFGVEALEPVEHHCLAPQVGEHERADDQETARDERAASGVYVEPPWARVVAVDPVTLEPVADGAIGLARIEDLANVDSAFAVQTQDRVRRVAGGFELLGRAPGAAPRGCSIAIDEMMSRSG